MVMKQKLEELQRFRGGANKPTGQGRQSRD
jgi:hypothetical protein